VCNRRNTAPTAGHPGPGKSSTALFSGLLQPPATRSECQLAGVDAAARLVGTFLSSPYPPRPSSPGLDNLPRARACSSKCQVLRAFRMVGSLSSAVPKTISCISCETGSFLGKVRGGTSERPPPRRELIVSYLLAVGVYSAHTLMPPHVVSYLRTMCLQEGCCMLTRLLCVYVSTVRPPVTSCILYRACRAS